MVYAGAGPPVEMILKPYQFNSANTERSRADHVTWNIDLQRTEALISAVFPVQLPDARMLGASMITITVEELLSSISSTSLLDGYLYLIWNCCKQSKSSWMHSTLSHFQMYMVKLRFVLLTAEYSCTDMLAKKVYWTYAVDILEAVRSWIIA